MTDYYAHLTRKRILSAIRAIAEIIINTVDAIREDEHRATMIEKAERARRHRGFASYE